MFRPGESLEVLEAEIAEAGRQSADAHGCTRPAVRKWAMPRVLFCLFASIVVERRPWLSSVLITGVSITVIYLVFSVFLEVPLPTGALGIGG